MNQAVETKLVEVRLQYACTMEELERLRAKTLTDEECLTDYVYPERVTRTDEETFNFENLRELKEKLNLIPEGEFDSWYLGEDYRNGGLHLKHHYERPETDAEYEARVSFGKKKKVEAIRTVREKNLRQNIKGLERKARGLEQMLKNLEPVLTVEEQIDRLLEGYEGPQKLMKRSELFKLIKEFRPH
jgi:hypothetical protein